MQVDLDWLGFDEGGHLLVKRALQRSPVGEEIRVTGSTPGVGKPPARLVPFGGTYVPLAVG